MSSRIRFSLPIALTIGGAVLGGCGKAAGGADTAAAEVPPVMIGPENLFVAESRVLQTGPVVSGTLTAERAATIRADLTSTVVQTLVEEGQPVQAGQLLGRLNDDAVRDQVLSAQSGVRTAAEALEVAKRNAERSEKLAKAGAVADQVLEQARWSVTNADGALADANARLAQARKQLGYTLIRSPIKGIVSERMVNAGDNVSAGNPLFAVVDPSSLRLEAQVPVAAVSLLKIGTPVPFAVDGYGDRQFEGRILRINPAVDPTTRQVRVTVGLPNTTGKLVAGLFAQGRVATESRMTVALPTSAIERRGLRPTVTKIENGVAKRIEVTLGIEDPSLDRVEIKTGLAAGDTVITGAARGMQPGTRVRPTASAERATASGTN